MPNLLKYISICGLFAMLAFSSCNDHGEKRLSEREREIAERDSALSIREKQLQIAEQRLGLREQELDSLVRSRDSVGVYNAKIVGNWMVTMNCTETNCTGYAVGDTKTEQWSISYTNLTLRVNASVNKKVVRTYTGVFRGNRLELTAEKPGPNTVIEVGLTLDDNNEKLLNGQRIIIKENECRTAFALRAEKI